MENSTSSTNFSFQSTEPVEEQPTKPLNPLIIVLGLLVAMALIGTTVLTSTFSKSAQKFANPRPTEAPIAEALVTTPEEPADPSLPAEQVLEAQTFEVVGVSLAGHPNWTATENEVSEKSLTLTNGEFSLIIVRDPIFTGGGFGLMFDGIEYENDSKLEEPISLAGIEATKVTHVVPAESFLKVGAEVPEGLDNIYGGSIIITHNDPIPSLTLPDSNGEEVTFLIKYEYQLFSEATNTTQLYSVDDPQYQEAINQMDSMVSSLQVL